MEAFQDLAEFGQQLAAVAVVVGGAIFYLRRCVERRGGLSERDRELIERMNASSVEAVMQLRDELEILREHGERISRLEGRLNGSR